MGSNAKLNVAVIFGGQSSEHEVSRVSVTMVLNNIDREKYNVYMTGITKDGKWYLYEGEVGRIADGGWETSGQTTQAFIAPDAALHGMVVMRESGAEIIPLDAVFPVMHGRNGEDGTIQGLCELAHIPCVGCGLTSSAVCLDKALTNTVLEYAGIPQAKFLWFYAPYFEKHMDEILDQIEDELGYPCFVKPANAGSSVGISKCDRRGDVIDARVTHLETFGAFADIGCGVAALMPIDAISVSRIAHPRDRFSVGMDIKAVVRSVENGRICLSHKELLGTWEQNAAGFAAGETVSGIVRSVENYGAFVELTPNLAGLAESREGVRVGQQASVYIKSIIPDKMKIKLIIIDTFGEPTAPAPPVYFTDAPHIDRFLYSPAGCSKVVETVFSEKA